MNIIGPILLSLVIVLAAASPGILFIMFMEEVRKENKKNGENDTIQAKR